MGEGLCKGQTRSSPNTSFVINNNNIQRASSASQAAISFQFNFQIKTYPLLPIQNALLHQPHRGPSWNIHLLRPSIGRRSERLREVVPITCSSILTGFSLQHRRCYDSSRCPSPYGEPCWRDSHQPYHSRNGGQLLKDLKQYCADSYKDCESAENVCLQYVNAIEDSIPNESRRDISSPLVARKFCTWCHKVFPKIIPVIVKLCEVGIICN